jgi:hypothetical protein
MDVLRAIQSRTLHRRGPLLAFFCAQRGAREEATSGSRVARKGQSCARRDADSPCTTQLVCRRALLDRGHCALQLHTLRCGRRIRSCRLSGGRRMAQAGRERARSRAARICLVKSPANYTRYSTLSMSGSTFGYRPTSSRYLIRPTSGRMRALTTKPPSNVTTKAPCSLELLLICVGPPAFAGKRVSVTFTNSLPRRSHQIGGTGSTRISGAGPARPPPLLLVRCSLPKNGCAAGSTDTTIVPAAPSVPACPSNPLRPS